MLQTFVKNCYRTPSRLFIVGETEITSWEGSTQGDPVSMAICGIRVTILINILIDILSNKYSANGNVMAYAGDFSAAGNLQDLRRWWSVLTEIGRKFSYYPEPAKTEVLVKPCASTKVKSVFFGTKIKVTTEGRIYLGGLVGTRTFKDLHITTKVGRSYC